MKQQYKFHLMAFLFAALLALSGLVAQSHSAYAGLKPPSGPFGYSESTTIVLDPVDLATPPHGLRPPTFP